jgi:predicted nucleotidyltransferase
MKDIIKKVSKVLTNENFKFVLVGALARDLIFEKYGIKNGLKTKDVDFGVLLDSWEEFESVKKILEDKLSMERDEKKDFRMYLGEIPVDILPFGKIAGPSCTVDWPGKFKDRLKVLGFSEAFENAMDYELEDGESVIKVVIPEMLLAMKIFSWSNSFGSRTKDANDMKLLLEHSMEFIGESDWAIDKSIPMFVGRMKSLISGSEVGDYLHNYLGTKKVIIKIMMGMNNGDVPTEKQDAELRPLCSLLVSSYLAKMEV